VASMSRFHWEFLVWRTRIILSARILLKAPIVYRNWIYFIFSRLGRKPGLLHLRNGLTFKIRPDSSDRSTISEVVILKTYPLDLKPGNIVVDVGANIGAFAITAATIVKHGTVFAIEPVSSIYDVLSENVRLNNLDNILLSNIALDASEGEQPMSVSGSSSSLYWGQNGETEVVRTTTLEKFMSAHHLDRIDYLKMDCEGAEFDILYSAGDHVLKRVRRIALEYHNRSSNKNALELKCVLEAAGFHVQIDGGSWNGSMIATAEAPTRLFPSSLRCTY
jgi:FkbM family methyltransferase